MKAAERRDAIYQQLREASAPLSASQLAKTLAVSRQIVVGDVALLRAGGTPVLATPRGYVLQQAPHESDGFCCTVACRHTAEQLQDELYAMVDCGCTVQDVIVEHPVYGQITGQLQLRSRYDVDQFCTALADNGAQPLCSLTGNVHLHTVLCPSAEQHAQMLQSLKAKHYLLQER